MGRRAETVAASPVAVTQTTESRWLSYKWEALLTVSVGTFMAVLDGTVINVALPTITDALHTDLSTVRWVAMAYLLAITALLMSVGRVSDLLGRKHIYTAGFIVFTIGSALCGISPTIQQLVLFRVLQGVGAAMIMAVGPAIITASFPSSERGKALGVNAVVVAATSTVGPSIGGLLVDHISWRAIFYLHVPIGALGVVMAQLILRDRRESTARESFDFAGAMMLSAALTAVVFALSSPDSLSVVPLVLAAVAGLGIFVAIERRAVHPLVDLSLFGNRLLSAASLSSLLSFMAVFAIVFLMPFYLEQVLGYDPSQVGILLIAQPLVIIIVAPFSGSLSDRFGSRLLSSVGMAVITLGLLSLSQLNASAGQLEVLGRLALVGLGQGLFQSPNNSAIMGSVPRHRLGFAASLLASMRNLGMVAGVAIGSAVFTARLAYYAGPVAPSSASFVGALHDAFLVSATIASVGIVASLVRGTTKSASAQA